MPFNNVISRADAAALIPQETSNEIIKGVAATNPLLQLARRLPNMSRAQKRIPVLNALATAYFVNGDTGLKQTTELSWQNVFIDAEEIAAIVPIPEAVLDDAEYDIWGEVRPQIVEALNVAIADAVINGVNIPATWVNNLGGAGLVARCTAAGHVVNAGAFPDMFDAIMSESGPGLADGVLMRLEADGFMATGHLAHPALRGRLRGLRDANGNPIFVRAVQERTPYVLDGEPISFATDGTLNPANVLMVSGQWDQLVYSIRQDITYKVLTEAVIQDAAGNIVYNLAQQDMVALRVVMRLGVALPNPINRMNQNALTRCAFTILAP